MYKLLSIYVYVCITGSTCTINEMLYKNTMYLLTYILLQRCSIYNQEIFLEKASFKISFRFSFGKSCRLSQKGLQTSGGSTKSGQVPN